MVGFWCGGSSCSYGILYLYTLLFYCILYIQFPMFFLSLLEHYQCNNSMILFLILPMSRFSVALYISFVGYCSRTSSSSFRTPYNVLPHSHNFLHLALPPRIYFALHCINSTINFSPVLPQDDAPDTILNAFLQNTPHTLILYAPPSSSPYSLLLSH